METILNIVWKAAVAVLLVWTSFGPVSSCSISSDLHLPWLEAAPVSPASGWDEPGWPAYWNDEYGFRIEYPPSLCLAKVPNALIAKGAVVTFVPAYDPSMDGAGAKTNLISFSVTIGVTACSRTSSQETTSCVPYGPEQSLDGPDSPTIRFARRHSAEGAAGNRYETLRCLADCGDRRYEIALFLHSGNPGCYAPGAITIFDSTEIKRLFETMLSTFLPVV
jgi:hypothetical protein